MKLDQDQKNLIEDICQTLLPKTTSPGAIELGIPTFVLKMMDDCITKKDQDLFMQGIKDFAQTCQQKFGKSFLDLNTQEKESFLGSLDKDPNQRTEKDLNSSSIIAFFQSLKQLSVFGYQNSQYFMTQVIRYELVPGRYKVHFPIQEKLS